MRKNVMRKNVRQSIWKSLGRYLAIVGIIALGSGIFVGLRTTKSDMVATGQKFTDQQNMFDLRLVSSVGWDKDSVDQIKQMPDVVDAEGAIAIDALVGHSASGEEAVYKLHAIGETVNQVYLLGGRMPEKPDECLADGFHATDDILGTTYTISQQNTQQVLDSLTQHTFTVVGYVSTPLYMDMSRGNTTLGSGSVESYLYLPPESFTVDYYTYVDITLPGDYAIYTDSYDNAMTDAASRFESAILPLAQARLQRLLEEAEIAYTDGLKQYEDGLASFTQSKADTLQELEDAKKELENGDQELADKQKLLTDSQTQLEQGRAELDKNRQTLLQTKSDTYRQLAQAHTDLLSNYQTVNSNLRQVEDGISQINSGLTQLDSGISQLESGLQQLELSLRIIDTMLPVVSNGLDSAEKALQQAQEAGVESEVLKQLQAELDNLKQSRDEYLQQQAQLHAEQRQYTQQLEDLKAQRADVQAQKADLEAIRQTLQEAQDQLDAGLLELQSAQAEADNSFAAAEAQLESAQLQLDVAEKELEAGKAAFVEGEAELASGWESYYSGYDTAMEELAKAETELADAKKELDSARAEIDNTAAAQTFALDRNTNVGYVALDSNSDIVEGVSAVFPAFFLLIAALVCITTMTRMVGEERTQIGTLKALGFSNFAIISKYLIYAGSAAVIGCGLGVVIGSVVFPLILWDAYSIMMLLLPDLVLQINWALCLAVLGTYTVVVLVVTWYCCRVTLREVPAELIRPKPPTSGRKILLERMPFWKRFSFLNKVMLRNIFRYRQRLLMMVVGIGGCTALLLTGFGFRDSIMDIVSYQYEEITHYDLEVRFSDDFTQEQMQSFREDTADYVSDLAFYHQSSLEIDSGEAVKDILMIVSDERLSDFIDFHSEDETLPYPGANEALLSIGMARNLNISLGDTVTLRDSNMRPLTVTISGIYDNYVYNYVILSPDTVQSQWHEQLPQKMACVRVDGAVDAHEAAADITELDGVLSISVNEDIANMVGSMLEALDMIVVTIVICAGLLAVIVLYNLTNINITERIREIATIKVLGFNAKESAAYVFKENLLLSLIGALVGLPGGILLLEFVMNQIQIDMVWMPARLGWLSYLLALLLTMLSACIVDFVLYFKLEKINMAEALKSVE